MEFPFWLAIILALLLFLAANAASTRFLVRRSERRILEHLRTKEEQFASWWAREREKLIRPEPSSPHRTEGRETTASDGGYNWRSERAWEESKPTTESRLRELTNAGPGVERGEESAVSTAESESTSIHPVEAAPPPLTEAHVQELYRRWCENGEVPSSTETLEISPLRYAKRAQATELSQPVYHFEDGEQIGDFVRFSRRGEGVGLVFPHPNARYNPEILGFLFEDVDDLVRDRQRLALVEPVRIRKRGAYWEREA